MSCLSHSLHKQLTGFSNRFLSHTQKPERRHGAGSTAIAITVIEIDDVT